LASKQQTTNEKPKTKSRKPHKSDNTKTREEKYAKGLPPASQLDE
jgi:hypothetical protein